MRTSRPKLCNPGNQGRDPESAGGVFGVGDGDIDPLRFDDVLHMVGDNAAPGAPKMSPINRIFMDGSLWIY